MNYEDLPDYIQSITDDADIETGDLSGLPEDMIIPKATYDPKYMHLQKLITDFITDFIMKNERDLFNYVNSIASEMKKSPIEIVDLRDKLLGEKNAPISKLIIDGYTKFFNKIFKQFHTNTYTPDMTIYVEQFRDMLEVCDYGYVDLLRKLYNIILDINLDLVRENFNTDTLADYLVTVGDEINLVLIDYELITKIMSDKNTQQKTIDIPFDIDFFSYEFN